MEKQRIYLWKPHDEVVRVGVAAGVLDLVLRDAVVPVADVLGDGRGEEHGFLTHHADVSAQPLDVHFAYVHPVDQNLGTR